MLSPVFVRAQDTVALKTCEQKDIKDVINSWRKNPKPPKPPKSGSLLLIPTITSNPATGVAIGAGGQYAFSGKKPGALYSSINGSATITTKKQFLFQLKNNIFLKGDNVFLSGDWRILLFSQSTYGLGTSAPDGGVLKYQYSINGWETADDSLVQPMKFNHIRFHQTISWRVGRSFFLGVGYHLDWMNKINDLKLDTALPLYTSHYLYSKNYGFDEEEYLLSGLSFNGSLDTRDNLVNPYKGIYANINWRLSPKFLGSKKTANILNLEWRSFHGLSASNPRHLLAFWFLGTFSETGKLPYLILPALGYDQRGRSGRGYTQGRFRGTNLVYSEAEYRFPISPCGGILGGVLFVNMTTASYVEKKEKLFNDVAPGYGFGLRMMVDKKSKTNLQVDFGFGKHSGGVYFGASETF
jgi:outer membrane protein assembly factor BamA